MGQLAKKGIFNGRKVPVEGLTALREEDASIDSFSRNCLEKCGLELITDKIILNESITAKEAEYLWANASLPVLLRLVAIKYPNPAEVALIPVKYFSLDEMLRKNSFIEIENTLNQAVEDSGFHNLRLWVSLRNFRRLPQELGQLFQVLKNNHPNVRLIAPSCSRIIAELAADNGQIVSTGAGGELAKIIKKLKKIGFFRLAESGCKDALGVCTSLQMPNHIVSRVTKFDSSRLVKEILMLRALNSKEEIISSWSPGVEDFVILNPGREYVVQRALAFGSLLLDSVPNRRINTKAISIQTLVASKLFGANANIHAAVDDYTARALSLHRLADLKHYFEIEQ